MPLEVTSGAGDVTAGKEAPVPRPNTGTRKRTRQNNPKLPTQNSETNGENVQHENAGGENDTQRSEHNAQRKESEANRIIPTVRTRRMEANKMETLRRLMVIVQTTK